MLVFIEFMHPFWVDVNEWHQAQLCDLVKWLAGVEVYDNRL